LADEEKSVNESIRALETELATVKAELATQEKWLKNHEGCRAGVRALLAAAGRGELPGLRGVLAEQLTIAADFDLSGDGSVKFNRDLGTGNNIGPGVSVIWNPNLLLNWPDQLSDALTDWREVAP